LKTARLEEDHGQRVAEDEHDGGAGSRREIERTGFLFDADVEMNVGVLGEEGFRAAGEGELSARMTSPSAMTPRSPCRALRELRTTAGEPVLVSVAAIFSPMWPDLPTPTTTTLPRFSTHWRMVSTASTNEPSSRVSRRCTSASSSAMTRRAFSR
jgi:hypothetical protein